MTILCYSEFRIARYYLPPQFVFLQSFSGGSGCDGRCQPRSRRIAAATQYANLRSHWAIDTANESAEHCKSNYPQKLAIAQKCGRVVSRDRPDGGWINDHTEQSDAYAQRSERRRHQLQRICTENRHQSGLDICPDFPEGQFDGRTCGILYARSRTSLSGAIQDYKAGYWWNRTSVSGNVNYIQSSMWPGNVVFWNTLFKQYQNHTPPLYRRIKMG